MYILARKQYCSNRYTLLWLLQQCCFLATMYSTPRRLRISCTEHIRKLCWFKTKTHFLHIKFYNQLWYAVKHTLFTIFLYKSVHFSIGYVFKNTHSLVYKKKKCYKNKFLITISRTSLSKLLCIIITRIILNYATKHHYFIDILFKIGN